MNVEVKRRIADFIATNFLFREGLDTVADNASFIEAGLIDSTGILELVSFIESEFGIVVADEEIVPDNLDSIAAITAYVERKLPVPAVNATATAA
jgi:acyl carrier protein